MDNTTALAVKILDEARQKIQSNMATHYRTSKGERWIDASGRSSEAFKVETLDNVVRLVYRGEDVAPLESIEYGSSEPPTLEQASRWREEKRRSGAEKLPTAMNIIKAIERSGGTERHHEPQEWIITPVIEEAVQELLYQLKTEAVKDIRWALFQ